MPTERDSRTLLSQAELDAFSASGTERFEAALREGGCEEGHGAYIELEAARRATTNRYLDWVALTDEYLAEAHASHPGRVHARLERTAELALRSGMGLAELELIQQVCAEPENAISGRMGEAVAKEDRDGMKAAWAQSNRIFRLVHDFRCDLLSDQLGAIYRDGGVEELEAAMMYAAPRGVWHRSMPVDLALEPTRRVRELAFFLTVCAHNRIRIVEEPERWVVHVDECGRCGRQCRDRYTDPDWGLEVVNEAGPVTFGRPPMTIYQTHFAVIHHMYAIDNFGSPWPVFDCRGLRADAAGCRMYAYKNPADTPAAFYEAVGRQRPVPAAGSQ